MIGVGAAAAAARADPADPALRPAAVGAGIANGPDNADSVLGAALSVAAVVVDVVTNGPVNSEQPFLQPVATGPTKVGADGGKIFGSFAGLALAVATGPPPSSPTTIASITHRSVARRLQVETNVLIPPSRVSARSPRFGPGCHDAHENLFLTAVFGKH
jgi:hypothetical protein